MIALSAADESLCPPDNRSFYTNARGVLDKATSVFCCCFFINILWILMLFSGEAYIYLFSYNPSHSVMETEQQYEGQPHPTLQLFCSDTFTLYFCFLSAQSTFTTCYEAESIFISFLILCPSYYVISTYYASQDNTFLIPLHGSSCLHCVVVLDQPLNSFSLAWSRICWFYSATLLQWMKKNLSVLQTAPARSGVPTVIRSVQSAWTVACVMMLMETVYVHRDSWGRVVRQVGISVTEETH